MASLRSGSPASIPSWALAWPLVLACAVWGCESAPAVPPDGPPCDVRAVFAEYECTSCHNATPGIVGGGLDLLSDDLEARLLDRPSGNASCGDDRVIDGRDPLASTMLRAIAPTAYAGHGSDSCALPRMPLGTDRTVSDAHVACVDSWVRWAAEGGGVEEPAPFDPAPVASAVAKVKYLLHGGATTDEELALATAPDGSLDAEGLRGLIDTWMFSAPGVLTEEFDTKLELFLELSLQQRRIPGSPTFTFQSQLELRPGVDPVVDRTALVANIPWAFLHTARDIVATGSDFRQVVTTRRWYVTTAILAAMVYADVGHGDSRGRVADADKFALFAHLTEPDFSDWRYVSFGQATAAEPPDVTYSNTAEMAERLRAIPDDGTLRLWAPRVGFFSTIVFLDNWETNPDNQFRVTTSQTVIGALDMIFEAGDPTTPASLDGLDEAHSAPGTSCYGCHRHLDPMRTTFSSYYSIRGQGLGAREGGPSTFAFAGHVVPRVDTMDELAEAIATHPRFGAAWAQKLCMWANSQRCVESDPEFQRVVQVFEEGYDRSSPDDDFRLATLVRELLSSTLITGASPSPSHERAEFRISSTRHAHFCQATRVRLAEAARLRCVEEGLAPTECSSSHAPSCFTGFSQALGLGTDDYARGIRDFVTPSTQDPVYSIAAREACRSMTSSIVSASGPFPSGGEPSANIRRIVEQVMGLPPSHPRHDIAVSALLRTYQILRTSGECPSGQSPLEANADIPDDGTFVCGPGRNRSEALRHVFVIACTSPDLIGLGF